MTNDHFSKLKIPVHLTENGQDIVLKFIEFQSRPEFAQFPTTNRNKVIKYVVYSYDPESPFVKNSSLDLLKRKESAAVAAGFERHKKTGEFDPFIIDIFEMKNEEVNNMIFSYLKMVNNYTWIQITTDEQLFWEYTALLNKPLEGSDEKKLMESANIKGKLREERNKIKQDLDKYKKEFYNNNSDLQEVIEQRITPETALKNLKVA